MVVPGEIRAELHAHAAEEAPNECCGLIVFRDGVAERYVRGRNRLASPYRYELEIDPEIWFLEDEGYELAVFHSHPETEPRPSRTDRELSGLWAGKPFLIYGLESTSCAPGGSHATRSRRSSSRAARGSRADTRGPLPSPSPRGNPLRPRSRSTAFRLR